MRRGPTTSSTAPRLRRGTRPRGQWLTNIRRPGGLGKTPYARSNRPAALAAIGPDWNPGPLGWTVDWQRRYTYLAQHLAEGARLTAVVPGSPRHGDGRRTVVRHPSAGTGTS
ncbi:hypothetical protein ABZ605_11740 [Streptomyces sp. NPDC012765]|uniref:hypothetical protein n=1 Tax=Streptomyces sp. NPDC012765 TaxID=3155249 RepID=UPI0033FC6B8C